MTLFVPRIRPPFFIASNAKMSEKQTTQNQNTGKEARFVSRLTPNTLALVLAGGRGTRLGPLTDWRTKPAVPFGGKFRIIDFTLSNCVNSNIRRILLLTQYKSHSLLQHVTQGWSNFNSEFGEFLEIVPARSNGMMRRTGFKEPPMLSIKRWILLTVTTPNMCSFWLAIISTTWILARCWPPTLTIMRTLPLPATSCQRKEARGFGVMQVDSTDRIIDFVEKPDDPQSVPGQPHNSLVSMGIYVFSRGLSARLSDQSMQRP